MAQEQNYAPRHAKADESETTQTSWVPNRKVVSGAVSGLLAVGIYWKFGPDVDPELAAGLTLAVMTLVSYFVPLPE